MLRDSGKLVVLLTCVVGLFALVIAGRATFAEVGIPLGAIIGYVTGNGVLAIRGKAPSPMIVPNVEQGLVAADGGRAVGIPVMPAPEPPGADPDFWEDRG